MNGTYAICKETTWEKYALQLQSWYLNPDTQ